MKNEVVKGLYLSQKLKRNWIMQPMVRIYSEQTLHRKNLSFKKTKFEKKSKKCCAGQCINSVKTGIFSLACIKSSSCWLCFGCLYVRLIKKWPDRNLYPSNCVLNTRRRIFSLFKPHVVVFGRCLENSCYQNLLSVLMLR